VGTLLAGDRGSGTGAGGIHTTGVEGITEVWIVSQRSDVRVAFGDVTEAELSVSPADSSTWHWETSVNILVASNNRPLNICFGWCGNQNEEVTITLPEDLEGKLSGDFELGSGRITAEGDFTNLDLEVA